jgi:NAD(P)-dependent dehydrogenase (short-subunit alcohol dehydrogenase family)
MPNAATCLITGASSGIGHSLAEQALKAGDVIVGVFRSLAQAETFAASAPAFHGVVADVTDTE